jgi:hypothetical protein
MFPFWIDLPIVAWVQWLPFAAAGLMLLFGSNARPGCGA